MCEGMWRKVEFLCQSRICSNRSVCKINKKFLVIYSEQIFFIFITFYGTWDFPAGWGCCVSIGGSGKRRSHSSILSPWRFVFMMSSFPISRYFLFWAVKGSQITLANIGLSRGIGTPVFAKCDHIAVIRSTVGISGEPSSNHGKAVP